MERIKIYKPPDGPAQAADFIEGLEPKLRDKVIRQIFYLSRTPLPELKEPHYKHFSIEKYQSLYELREKGRVVVRIIFTPCSNGDYLLLHAFVKRQKRDTCPQWRCYDSPGKRIEYGQPTRSLMGISRTRSVLLCPKRIKQPPICGFHILAITVRRATALLTKGA